LWNAKNSHDWAIIAQQQDCAPTTILEALKAQSLERYDSFQSTVLIASHYDCSSGSMSRVDASIDRFLDNSATTQYQLSLAKLAQLVPTRALLAVLGETWVLGTKISQEEFSALKRTLQAWISQLWSCPISDYTQPTAEAVRISVDILKQLLKTSEPLAQGIGSEIGIFLAALVVCAATAAASSRFVASSFSSQHVPSPFAADPHSTTVCCVTDQSAYLHQITLAPSADRRSSIPYPEILSTTSSFLSSAIDNIMSFNLAACHTGCRSLLLWVKMHLRGASLREHASATDASNSTDYFRGENINEAITQIERMLNHGWEDWGI
jgi:hypothetical protein